MPEYGGIRYDFDVTHHLTTGEKRPVAFRVKDVNGADITNFDNWVFEWFLRRGQRDANGLAQLRVGAVRHLQDADIARPSPPIASIIMDLERVRPDTYWHELWRIDGNPTRLAYGDVVVEG